METLEAKDLQHLLHPVTYYRSYPANGAKVAATASNVYVRNTGGKQYLDGVAGLWCTAIGYGDKELARVAKEQIEKLSFSPLFFGRSNEPSILLAEKLKSMMPFDAGRVFFGLFGSDANDTQMKLMWYYHNAIGETRGRGLLGAVEIVQDKASKAAYPVESGVGVHCMARCEANGLLLRPLGDSLAISPPLVITETQVNELFDILEKSLNETLDWTVRNSA